MFIGLLWKLFSGVDVCDELGEKMKQFGQVVFAEITI
jgi:hypothetical protein